MNKAEILFYAGMFLFLMWVLIFKKQLSVKEMAACFILTKRQERQRDYIFIFVMVIILIVMTWPMTINGLKPAGGDSMASIAETHQVRTWEDSTGKTALWNPYIFGGMPLYHRVTSDRIRYDHTNTVDNAILFIVNIEFYLLVIILGLALMHDIKRTFF